MFQIKSNRGFTPTTNRKRLVRGFTLIEILIASTVLVLVGVGVIAVEKQFIGSASTNKHKLQATGLAQEGINLVKAKFGSNVLCTVGCPSDPLMILPSGQEPSSGVPYYLDGSNVLQSCTTCNLDTPGPWRIEDNGVFFLRTIIFP